MKTGSGQSAQRVWCISHFLLQSTTRNGTKNIADIATPRYFQHLLTSGIWMGRIHRTLGAEWRSNISNHLVNNSPGVSTRLQASSLSQTCGNSSVPGRIRSHWLCFPLGRFFDRMIGSLSNCKIACGGRGAGGGGRNTYTYLFFAAELGAELPFHSSSSVHFLDAIHGR